MLQILIIGLILPEYTKKKHVSVTEVQKDKKYAVRKTYGRYTL